MQSGHLGGAGLDHFVGEHIAPDHPLCSMSNVVLTPHIGGATYDTEANHSRLIADDLRRLLSGERPQHICNPEVLEQATTGDAAQAWAEPGRPERSRPIGAGGV